MIKALAREEISEINKFIEENSIPIENIINIQSQRIYKPNLDDFQSTERDGFVLYYWAK